MLFLLIVAHVLGAYIYIYTHTHTKVLPQIQLQVDHAKV